MTHYEILGMPRDADTVAIKKAYRKLARKLHPDLNGGKSEPMQALQAAYDCLMDPARRAAYDAGDATPELQLEHEAIDVLEIMIAEAMEGSAIMDVVIFVRNRLEHGDAELEAGLRRLEAQKKKWLRWQGRIVRNGEGPNIAEQVLEKKIKEVEESINSKARAKRIGLLALELLAVYSDKGPQLSVEGEMRLRWSEATTGVKL